MAGTDRFSIVSAMESFYSLDQGQRRQRAEIEGVFSASQVNWIEFWVVVISFVLEEELRWMGRLMFPSLFSGEHYFLI